MHDATSSGQEVADEESGQEEQHARISAYEIRVAGRVAQIHRYPTRACTHICERARKPACFAKRALTAKDYGEERHASSVPS